MSAFLLEKFMSLGIEIHVAANTAQFTRNISKVGKQSKQAAQQMQSSITHATSQASKGMNNLTQHTQQATLGLNKLSKMGGIIAKGIAAATGVFASVSSMVSVRREFDVLNASLITATGSAQAASEQMDKLKDFAQTTPYDLAQAVDGFVKLKNLGLNPSINSMTSFGNTASAMGKDLSQMIEAVADATTFEFERLKEFGIKASQQKDKVAFTFQGITTEVSKNADAIQDYLLNLGNVNFASAMAERMNTLDGAIANLEGSYKNLLLAIGDAKIIGDTSFMDLLKQAAFGLSTALDWVSQNIQAVMGAALMAVLAFSRGAIVGIVRLGTTWVAQNTQKIASNIAAATSTERLGNALMSLLSGTTSTQIRIHHLTVAIKAKTAASLEFIRQTPAHIAALKASGTQALATARNFSVMTATKKASIASATLLGRGVMGIGTALTSLGRILLRHPLMVIAGVISAVIVRTMGLQKAMDSLSEATAVLGELLGQMVDAGIKGFKWLGDVTLDFFSRFRSDGKQSTNQVLGFFWWLFKGTRGGFVGVLQVIARVFDLASATIKTFCQYAFKNIKSLGTAIANVFKGIGNFAISVFEGLINHISKKINVLIDGMNAVSDFFGGGQIKRLDSVSFGRLSYGSIDFGVAGFFDAVKSNNNQYLEGKLLAAHDKITDAANQSKDAHDDLASSLDATSKASENATKNTKKNENAQKSLTDAIKEQYLSWQKLRYEMAHPLNLEIDKVNWEIANGKFKGIDEALKKQLQDAARAMDLDIIHDELDKLVQQTAIDNMNRGQTGKLAELLGHLDNSRHKFSLLKDEVIEFNEQGKRVIKTTGKLGVALSQMALADWHEYAHASNQSIGELDKQIELVKAKGDFSKELLAFEHEYQATLDKYAHLAELDDTKAYTLIKNQAKQLKLRQQMLATQTAYQDILDGLQDEESKKLGTLQNQLDVIAKQHKLMQSMPQMSSAIDPLDASFGVLNQALDLPSVPMNAMEQLESEHQSRLDMIKGFLERQQELYKGNEDALTRITEQGEQARTAAKQHYEEAKNKLILTESESLFGSLASIARDGLGEQSKVYRAMFAMQQGFAIAQAGLAMQQAISKGLAKGFPTGLSDMALAVSHGAKIISAIKSVVMPVGQAHDGIMSVPKSGTWNLEKGERVLPKHTAKALDDKLNNLQNGGGVVINQHITINADGSHDVKDDTQNQMGQAFKAGMLALIQGEMRQGRSIYNFVKNGR
ncbi:tape measure protein [Moraxella bovoculi]|uniref:tape measure protein n=1 Tax=Moraxella bovoculi TaxID=386891 RepID=UPI0009B9723F|nr:tape measure protein [Moraxella bovoculi]